jgi:hypothetical protein
MGADVSAPAMPEDRSKVEGASEERGGDFMHVLCSQRSLCDAGM